MTERVVANRIGGVAVDGGEPFPVNSPYTGETVAIACSAGAQHVEDALRAAESAQSSLARSPRHERSERLLTLAGLFRRDAEKLAGILVEEVGKPIKDSLVEVQRAEEVLRLTAAALLQANGHMPPMDASPAGERRLGFEIRVAAGVVVAIAPFNAPLNLAVSKMAAALGAGCPVILKSPPQAPGAITHVADLVMEAGWAAGSVAVLHGGAEPGQALVSSPVPRVVTFTGSVGAGVAITREAGLKRLVLELGSNAPTIVCRDADIEDAAEQLVRGAYSSAGQACISTQRILVHEDVADRFLDAFLPRLSRLVVGDPANPATDMGPVIDDAAAARVQSWVQDAVDRGARLVAGKIPDGSRLIEPVLLSDVPPEARVCSDEIFGPVAILQTFGSDAEAIQMANGTEYGLQAGVFTESLERAIRYAEELDFGGLQINDSSRVRLDLHSFGGRKNSGVGLEGVHHALESMTEVRFVGVRRKSRPEPENQR